MVGYADADERAAAGDLVGDVLAFWEQNGEWAGKILLDNSLFERGEGGRMRAEHVEVAHEKEEGFMSVAAFGREDFLDGGGVQSVGENAVNRVGGRDDEVALFEFGDDARGIHGLFVVFMAFAGLFIAFLTTFAGLLRLVGFVPEDFGADIYAKTEKCGGENDAEDSAPEKGAVQGADDAYKNDCGAQCDDDEIPDRFGDLGVFD